MSDRESGDEQQQAQGRGMFRVCLKMFSSLFLRLVAMFLGISKATVAAQWGCQIHGRRCPCSKFVHQQISGLTSSVQILFCERHDVAIKP